jgi:putative transposase
VDDDRALLIASFRYRIIADAAEGTDESVAAAIAAAARRTYVDPDGHEQQFSERTLWRWLKEYRSRGLLALRPKQRTDKGSIRAIAPEVLQMAAQLRRERETRATDTILDILMRKKMSAPARSTLDRHLAKMGLSRKQLYKLGKKLYQQVRTDAPFELIVADFHHGPYVRLADDDRARRALLLAFIDHFSRAVPEGRYYLHEDFAALRFGFRRVLTAFGCFVRLYVDNGPSFQTARFHAACKHELINIELMHSKPYQAEGRGVCERFNRTLKEQFESEVKDRDELLTLDELNAYFEAWLHERYHRDNHSGIDDQPPIERFQSVPPKIRPAPDLAIIDELLRLREKRKVHKKWSTIEVHGIRYLVDPPLRGRWVHALYDPFDTSSVLVEFDGRIVQRAEPQRPGEQPPPLPPAPPPIGPPTDYLAMLRADYEKREKAELSSIHAPAAQPEISLIDLIALIETCRGAVLSDQERGEVSAFFRKMRPIDPDAVRSVVEALKRGLGTALHLRVYLDALQTALVRRRMNGGYPR